MRNALKFLLLIALFVSVLYGQSTPQFRVVGYTATGTPLFLALDGTGSLASSGNGSGLGPGTGYIPPIAMQGLGTDGVFHFLKVDATGAVVLSGGTGVASINGLPGAFSFTGAVSCTLTTCNFTGGGGGSPGGSAYSVQYNNAGALGGASLTSVGCFSAAVAPVNCTSAQIVAALNLSPGSTPLSTSLFPTLPYISSSTVLAATLSPVANEFVTSYNAATGLFTLAQPTWSNIGGTVPYLAIANNLSDLSNVVTARANLQLGTAAITATTDYDAAGTATSLTTASALLTKIQGLTGCNTAGYVLTPQSSQCVAQTGSTGTGLGDPGSNGFVYRTSSDVTAPATYTQAEALLDSDTVNNTAVGYHAGSGGDGTVPTPTEGAWYTAYKGGMLQASHNGDAYAPANPMSCQPGITNGPNAIPAGTYPNTICRNESGHTWNITAIRCVADTGASTCNATNGAGTALLAAAITGTPTYATGTQSSTVTVASGDYLMVTFVADGTAHQIGIDVAGWY